MASKRRKHDRAGRQAPSSVSHATAAATVKGRPARFGPFAPFLTRLGDGDSRIGAGLAAVLIVTASIFSRCLTNGFVFDDSEMIVLNRFIGQWSFIWKSLVRDSWWFRDPLHLPQSAYYRPLQDIWFALNFHLFGLKPMGWHATMVALHLIVVWLVFRVASHLTADRLTGLIAAALFALMPIHAEAIVWASAIPLPLAAAFELAAFEFYLRGAQPRWRAASLGFFAGALLSHESAVVFPLLIAAHAFLLVTDKSDTSYRTYFGRARNTVFAVWPYAAETVGYFALRYWVLGFISRANPTNHMTAREIALTIPGAIASYAMLLAAPWRAGPSHRLDIVENIAASGFYLPIAGLAVLCVAGWLLIRRHPHRRLYLFCAAWIFIALGPELNLGGLFAKAVLQDRYLYVPSFGFCVMAADLAMSYSRGTESRMRAMWAAAAAVGIVYAGALFSVQGYWHDEVALFTRCAQEVPGEELWHNRLGLALQGRGELAGARVQFEKAVSLDPGDGASRYDLGLVYRSLGDHRRAANEMAAGLKLLKHPPPGAYAVLAESLDAAGDSTGAQAALATAAALPGGYEIATMARAQLRLNHGDTGGAEAALHELLAREPNIPRARALLDRIERGGAAR
ncbi:MAG: hypothetical protein ACREQI_13890 [Candidatus Binataceae bacterium]